MRTVTKGGQPQNILICLDQALERPYCAQGDMNRAMGYVEGSTTGPHYVALAWLAGLLDEQPIKCWLRPTAEGRAVVKAGSGTEVGVLGTYLLAESAIEALWDALLALPSYQRYLLHQLLDVVVTARAHDAQLAQRIEGLAYGLFPLLRDRVEEISERLGLGDLPLGVARSRLLAHEATLEPIDFAPLRSWAAMQGCGGEKSDFTRAERIALLLERASRRPLRLDTEWLTPEQAQAAILLAAARERGLGCVVARHGDGEGALALARGIEALRRGGVDVRIERRAGGDWVAALAQPVALHAREAERIEAQLAQARGTPREASAELIAAALRRRMRTGADGMARGALDLEELGQACLRELRDGVGEPAAHPAAAEAGAGPRSRVAVGPPLPLASDLPRLGVAAYRFLDEAVRVRGRRCPAWRRCSRSRWRAGRATPRRC